MPEGITISEFLACISNTAGTYVCNHLMYGVFDLISRERQNVKAGFIQVLFIPEQDPEMKSLVTELGDIIEGFEAVL